MGTSISSQRKKNRNRSRAMNTPTTPARPHSRLKWKNPTRSVISDQEASTATMPSQQVSTTISRLSPSIPSCKAIPKRGTHGTCSAAIHGPPAARVRVPCRTQSHSTRPRSVASTARAIQRGTLCPRRSAHQASAPPAMGTNNSQARITTAFPARGAGPSLPLRRPHTSAASRSGCDSAPHRAACWSRRQRRRSGPRHRGD